MQHTIDFFRDEIRSGFYVPTVMKQAWASVLDVLFEIDQICTRHDIKYFADWGTILGAVRHGGFIPWDDDLDICMLRDDYEKFRAVCDAELPKGYCIHDYERKENHWMFLARVVNNSSMCFDEEYLRTHHNFPYLASVDIFIKDYLYEDEKIEKKRCEDIMHLLAEAELLTEQPDKREETIALYRKAEKRMSEVKPGDTSKVGQIFPWLLKNGFSVAEEKSDYETIVRLPFEDMTIPVPACYHRVLFRRYGNYNEIHKGWAGHNYPFFEGQKAEMERVSGTSLPQFDLKQLSQTEMEPREMQKENERKQVVFLPVGPSEWKAFQKTYDEIVEKGDADIYVIPLPLLKKDFFNNIYMTDEEIIAATKLDEYPADLPLYSWLDYDVEAHQPDEIYIQNPYDEWNPCLMVPPLYFAKHLRENTQKLIYIPIGTTAEFTVEDYCDVYHLKHYVTTPGVAYADEVRVQSENIKARYIEALTAAAGETTAELWKKKIVVSEFGTSEARNFKDEKKRVLYCIGISEFAEYREALIQSVNHRLDVFEENIDKIQVSFLFYPNDTKEFERIDAKAYQTIRNRIDALILENQWDVIELNISRAEETVECFDAYYGSSSPLVPIFTTKKKPVMIANYEID